MAAALVPSEHTQIDYPRGITFEQVWAALMEDREQIKKSREDFDRRMEESREESRKEREKSRENWERELKESRENFNKQIGSLTNLFGDFTLGMLVPKLREKFRDFGFVFLKSCPNFDVNDKINNISFEVDILLENGDKAMLIEVKTKLTNERITKHAERLEKMRKYADLHGDKRTFMGAVAGFAVADEVRKYASEQGFYLIEPDGENFNITPPDGNPKEW